VKAEELEAKLQQYTPQIRLYAYALARIYARPITRRWLHFIVPGQTLKLAGGWVLAEGRKKA